MDKTIEVFYRDFGKEILDLYDKFIAITYKYQPSQKDAELADLLDSIDTEIHTIVNHCNKTLESLQNVST